MKGPTSSYGCGDETCERCYGDEEWRSTPRFKGEPIEPGCYIDENRGQYAIGAMLKLVDDMLGTHYADEIPKDGDGDELGTYGEGGPWSGLEPGSPAEILTELSDKAEEALNSFTTGPARWEWWEGNFMLSVYEEDEEDEDDED